MTLIIHTEEVIIGSEQGTMFPTRVGTTVCNALIDTGATRCCMSETYYKKLQLPKIQLLQNVSVRSATGSNLAPIGLVNCTFMLGDTPFDYDFIVCKNLTRPLILGRDFLIQNHIAVRYSDDGRCILRPPSTRISSSNRYRNKTSLEFNKFSINTRKNPGCCTSE